MSGIDKREKIERMKIIIRSAKKLFQLNGFEKTTMHAISSDSEFTCRTIYRYFSNKEDLFFATIFLEYERLFETMIRDIAHEEIGYKKIQCAVYTYQKFASVNNNFIPCTIKANELLNNLKVEDMTQYQQAYMDIYKEIFNYIAHLFHFAQFDKSIRTNVDATKLAISTILTITGFLNMQELTSEKFNSRFGMQENEIIDFTISRLFENMKNKS